MKSKQAKGAVMTLEKGEEFVDGRATAKIPQVGIYKLLAKKKRDGTIEWAHFVEREDGLRDRVLRGTVQTMEEFNIVIDAVDRNLRRIFGTTMQPASYDVRMLEGKKVSETVH